MTLINRLESLCPSYRYLMILRNNPTFIAFIKRWQLPVYFQLRFKEIISHLENALSGHGSRSFSIGSESHMLTLNLVSAAPTAVQTTSLIMASSEAVYRAVRTCWNDDIYLPVLAGRFWRLTLQVRQVHVIYYISDS